MAKRKSTKKYYFSVEGETEQANLNAVRRLMSELKMTLEQALDVLALDNNQRALVTKQLQK